MKIKAPRHQVFISRGRRGCDRMIDGFTTIRAISAR